MRAAAARTGSAGLPPRWGIQTGVWQPRQPAFWLLVIALAGSLTYFLTAQASAIRVSPAGWSLSWLLLVLYIVPVVLVMRWLDKYEPEPRSLLVAAFVWGAWVATLLAGLGNDLWGAVVARLLGGDVAARWSDALTAPPIEEIYKYLGVVVIFLIARAEIDDLIDGFVYGALVGLGFAVVEDVLYFMYHFGGGVADVLNGFFVRVIASGLYTHVLFTAISGIGLAYFVRRQPERRFGVRLAVAAGLLLLAMLAHFVWNSPWLNDLPLLFLTLFKGMPFLIAAIVLVRLAERREDDALALILESEVGQPGLLPAEMELLRNRSARGRTAERLRKAAGPKAAALFRQLQREQIKLALVRTAVDTAEHADVLQQRALIQALRQRLWGMSGVTAALALSPEALAEASAMPAPPVWAVNATVGPFGGTARATPRAAEPRRLTLPAGLPLQALMHRDDWVLVQSADGRRGWMLDAELARA